ncbi:hypothetical protein ACPXCG_18835 [Gordonia sp. DT218]|uniref:hypothetical protein n=1 Tax=Gordonia sp. DT218 TaxID=3416659 RepID=UPI003CEE8531
MYVINKVSAGHVEYRCKICCADEARQRRARKRQGLTSQPKTHCRNGHEYTPENTRILANGDRRCCTCARAANRRAYTPQETVVPIRIPERRTGWRDNIVCGGRDEWLSEDPMTQTRAARECRRCPGLVDCAIWTLGQEYPQGVCAGEVFGDRWSAGKRRRLEAIVARAEVAS